MSADKVTPIRDWHEEAWNHLDSLSETFGSLPWDDPVRGYKLSMQTVVDLRRICQLLDEVQQLFDGAVERESGPYNELEALIED